MDGKLSGLLVDPSASFIPKFRAHFCGFLPLLCLPPRLPPPTPWLPPLVPLDVEGVGDGILDDCLLPLPLLRFGVWVLGRGLVLVLMSVDPNLTSSTTWTSSSSPPTPGVNITTLVSSSLCSAGGGVVGLGLLPGKLILVLVLPLVPGRW